MKINVAQSEGTVETNGEGGFFMSKELRDRISELEGFVKTYYNVFLESRHTNENMRISHNDQYFLYCKANRLLGEPNGKRLSAPK